MDDLRPIRTFLEVADQQSFSGAARSLGLTPASVTRIVAALERDLDRQLLVRTTRQVSLTSDGALIAARYRPLLAEFDDTTRGILSETAPDAGHLRINAPLSLGLQLMPDVTSKFRAAYSNITLDVHLTDALIDVISDYCDLAIRVSGPPTDKSTIWRKIREVPRYAVASPALFPNSPPQSPDDIDPALALSYSPDREAERWHFSRGSAKRTLRAGQLISANNGDLLQSLAVQGHGICVLPDLLVADALANGSLIRILPDWSLPPLWLTLFYPPYEKLPPLVATFSDFFESYVAEKMSS
ncbi:MAG: LysR family transcriptional regulator [Pseudomonadota bacterium]